MNSSITGTITTIITNIVGATADDAWLTHRVEPDYKTGNKTKIELVQPVTGWCDQGEEYMRSRLCVL